MYIGNIRQNHKMDFRYLSGSGDRGIDLVDCQKYYRPFQKVRRTGILADPLSFIFYKLERSYYGRNEIKTIYIFYEGCGI